MPNRIPEPAEKALRELTWRLMTMGSNLSAEANDVVKEVVASRGSAAKGPIHLAAHALMLAKKLGDYVVAVGYIDYYRSGYIAVSGLPNKVFPSDYVALCKLSYGLIEACNDPSLMMEWAGSLEGKEFVVRGLSVSEASAIILEVLRREGKLKA